MYKTIYKKLLSGLQCSPGLRGEVIRSWRLIRPCAPTAGRVRVAEAPWSERREWAAALGFDHPRAAVLVLVLG